MVETLGDVRRDEELWQLGGRGIFVREVQAAVLEGRADFAVHSAKDLPSTATPGLVIAAFPGREDPRDALVGRTLDDLPAGARVGTGSVRRRAQLYWLRPDLTFGNLRGNIETRLAKSAEFDAVVVAAAALARLGRRSAAAQMLPPDLFVPQAGQGALAVECREDDAEIRQLLATIDDGVARTAVTAERAFLAEVGGGCDVPLGAYATVTGDCVSLRAVLCRLDGNLLLRHEDRGTDPVALGRAVAGFLLDDCGGRAVLGDLLPALPG